MYLRHLLVPSTDRGADNLASGYLLSYFLRLSYVAHALTINPGQLGLQINTGLPENGICLCNSIAQFEDDISATW